VQAWGPPAEVLGRDWKPGGAFSGHDHDAPATRLCEDDE
jgi:hypothetical protein